MFSYCTRVLHLAEGAAYNRIEAARAARSYPLILDLFEQSAITLTTVRLLAPHLTVENHSAVLTSATHKTKREIEELAASLKPKPDAPVVVRKLPTPRTTPVAPLVPTPKVPPASVEMAAHVAEKPRCDISMKPPAQARIEPLAPERYRIQLTVSRETHDKFRRAQALLRHSVPSGDAVAIFDRALTLLVERLEHQRFAETARPHGSTSSVTRSRHIPGAVRRAVWRRDAGRCAFAGMKDDAPRRVFSSSTMSSHSPPGEWRAWRTSSCVAARTTCMRRNSSSGPTSCGRRGVLDMTRFGTSRRADFGLRTRDRRAHDSRSLPAEAATIYVTDQD